MSTSIETSIDRAGGGSFRVTGRNRTGGNFTMDIDRGRVEMVLGGAEGMERNMD